MANAEDLSLLPPTLRRIAEICDFGTAVKLAAEFGGTDVYIPKEPDPDSVLVRVIGAESVEKLIREFGGGHLEIPLGPYHGVRRRVWAAIRKNLQERRSNAKTARAVGVHQRTVQRHRQQLEPEELPLFKDVSKGG